MHHDPEADAGTHGWDASLQARSLVQVLWHRKAFVLLGAFLGLALSFLWHTQRSPQYQSNCQLLVIQKQKTPLAFEGDPSKQFFEDYTPMHVALLRSPLILERAVKKRDLASLPTFENVGDPAGFILGNLIVARDTKETGGVPNNIIILTQRGPVAEDCGKVLQAILDSYQEYLDVTYRNVSDQTLELITKARDVLEKDLAVADDKYLKFRQNSPTIWKNKEGVNIEQDRVAAIETERTQMHLRKIKLRDRIAALEKAIAEGKGLDVLAALPKETNAEGKSLAGVRYVEEPLMPLILKEQELLEDFGDDHPQVKSIRKRIEKMRAHLSKLSPDVTEKDPAKRALLAMKYDLGETELALQSTAEIVEKLKADARTLMNYEIQENHLRNEVARLNLIYDTTVKRLQQIILVRDSPGGFNAQPLSTPGVGHKIAPVAYQDLGLGLIVGLLLGAGLAYLAELSDKSFRNPEEIRKRLGLPLVGHIPFITADAETERKRAAGELCIDPLLCTHFRPKSMEAEAYRAVRTALFFATQGVGHKVIQVTSPNKSDGKSLMIANLAVMVAQSGKRVLLVDADLRRPRQHKIFGVEASAGLAKLMAGEVEPPDVIATTCVPGLSILPCGTVPPNPSELLTSPRFKELLDKMRDQYDYVLVDTPPLLAVTDPCIVAGKVDGMFLTIRLTRKGRPDAERAREILTGLNVKVFGIVVNGITRATAGIYSPHAYDYTETYGQDEPEGQQDYYYYEDDEAAANGAPATAANGSAAPSSKNGGKGFWGRWWPGT